MSGEWIKMRVSLAKDPAVIAIADHLAASRAFMDWLTNPVRRTCDKSAYEHVTRNVTVSVTVSALLQIWGTANEIGKPDGDDLILRHTRIDMLDEVCGVPGFGSAIASVDWAVECEWNGKTCVRLPKFLINNVPQEDRSKRSAAERQRRYREKHNATDNAQSNGDSDVTRDVTVTHREEKRREEQKIKNSPATGVAAVSRFDEFWSVYPTKVGKKPCAAKWKLRKFDRVADLILADVRRRIAEDRKWRDGYVPNPETYLNQERWNDGDAGQRGAAGEQKPDWLVGAV